MSRLEGLRCLKNTISQKITDRDSGPLGWVDYPVSSVSLPFAPPPAPFYIGHLKSVSWYCYVGTVFRPHRLKKVFPRLLS